MLHKQHKKQKLRQELRNSPFLFFFYCTIEDIVVFLIFFRHLIIALAEAIYPYINRLEKVLRHNYASEILVDTPMFLQ
jgi:hypothetical protein